MKKYYLIAFLIFIGQTGLYAQLKVHPFDVAQGRYNMSGDAVTEDYKPTAPTTIITFAKNYVEIDVNNKQYAYYWVKQTKDIHNQLGDGIEFTCKDKDYNTIVCTVLFELKQTTSWIYFPDINSLHIYRSKPMRAK